MRTLTFYGSSDDIFCFEERANGQPCGGDEAYLASDGSGGFRVGNDHAGMVVVGTYSPEVAGSGCWTVGVSQLDEDVPLPAWPMRFETAKSGYSAALVIEVPESVTVTDAHPADA